MKKPAQEMGIYALSKFCPLAARKGQNCPSGQPLGRSANGHFYDRRSGQSQRSTARSTGPYRRVGCFQSADRVVDRPSWLAFVHVPCTSVDRDGRPTPGLVDRPVDRQSSLARDLGIEN